MIVVSRVVVAGYWWGGGGGISCCGGTSLLGMAIALISVVFSPCGDEKIDFGDGVGLSGDPERGIIAGVFVTVVGAFLVLRSEFQRLLMLMDRYLDIISIGLTELMTNVSLL